MNATEINENKPMLEILLNNALIDVMKWIRKSISTRPREEDYVAALAVRFSGSLFHILQAVFPEKTFAVTGIYKHQKLSVRVGDDIVLPLGDLLLIYAEKNRESKMLYNSMLLRTEISSGTEKRIKPGGMYGLELYKNWPEFVYCGEGSLEGLRRNIHPKTIHAGAQYLMIDENPVTNGICGDMECFPMGVAMPDRMLRMDGRFTDELLQFLKFKAGRTFDEVAETEDDWSRMVWDLLAVAKNSYMKRKKVKPVRIPRETTCVRFCPVELQGKALLDCFEKRADYPENGQWNEEAGVSVILIECVQ